MSVQALKNCIEIIKKSKDFTRAEKAELLGIILAEINRHIMESEDREKTIA